MMCYWFMTRDGLRIYQAATYYEAAIMVRGDYPLDEVSCTGADYHSRTVPEHLARYQIEV